MTNATEHLKTALADRYAIDEELGAGGMATVYLAHDVKHDRKVAIKVLRPELAAVIGSERFLREIKLAANLNHPHILGLHDSGSAGDALFYVMPYVEGESLRDKLNREKQLAVDEAVRIGGQVASALDYAHRQGVVHRDIKPENILMHEGVAVVADFGIALAVNQAGGARLTETGLSLGTPHYMSPEQATGDRDIDARTDIYALGAVLYELLTGEPPFNGATAQAIIARVLTERPTSPRTLRDAIPVAVERAALKALARSATDRFATAAEFGEALRAEDTGPGDAAEKSIAVLPFSNMSGSSDDEYFADGMTEEIINALSQLEGLHVAARTSSFAFKGRHEDLRVVGEKLGVTTVLEGSVRRAGQRLRITAQLVNVADGYHFWSERYDREMTDIFAIQDEIAAAIAAKFEIASAPGDAPARRGTDNLEAYELFMKGRALQERRGPHLYAALDCFARALELDPEYAAPAAWTGDAYRLIGLYGLGPSSEYMPKAKAAAERAIAWNPDDADALVTLAAVAMLYERNFAKAVEVWQRALAVNPKHTRARSEYGVWSLAVVGGSEDAPAETGQSVSNDPLNAWAWAMHAFALAITGRTDEGVAAAREAVTLDPESFVARWSLIETLTWAGDYAGAIEEGQRVLATSGRAAIAFPALTECYAGLGRADAADAMYAELTARSRTGYVPLSVLAATAAIVGRIDEADAQIREAIEVREGLVVLWIRAVQGRALREVPGFRAFLATLT